VRVGQVKWRTKEKLMRVAYETGERNLNALWRGLKKGVEDQPTIDVNKEVDANKCPQVSAVKKDHTTTK